MMKALDDRWNSATARITMDNQNETERGAKAGSPLAGVTGSALIRFKDEQPPNDYNYRCIIVFNDGYETLSDGGSVHDTCVKSKIAYAWRKLAPNGRTEMPIPARKNSEGANEKA